MCKERSKKVKEVYLVSSSDRDRNIINEFGCALLNVYSH